MKNKSDIAALESVSFAKNYNDYVLKLISKNLDKNDKILDFGAGYGLFTKMLIDCGYDVISVEINDEAIKKLNKKNIKNYKSVKEINEKIDCVISLNVLEHIDDDFETLLMLNNAMPNGGKLILYLPASILCGLILTKWLITKEGIQRKIFNIFYQNQILKLNQYSMLILLDG